MSKNTPKQARLKEHGLLNPHPEQVIDARFQADTFFDPSDIVQVKYEMLRLVQQDAMSKTDAAAQFGFSRPTFYQAEIDFAQEGLAGLIPRQRGPKGAHKLDAQTMQFVDRYQQEHGRLGAKRLTELIQEKFGFKIHPRSIERAIARKKKR